MPFDLWRDLAVAYVRVVARGCGWTVRRVKASASSRSWYVELRCGAAAAVVRLSDHRPVAGCGRRASMLSVRQAACGRLAALPSFLSARAAQHAERTIPLPATGNGCGWTSGVSLDRYPASAEP